MKPLLLNRDFKLPADGFVHVVPVGEYPHPSGVVQVVDDAAIDAMLNHFGRAKMGENFPGLLVDFDHFSDDTSKPSEAAGWITELTQRRNGIHAKVRWSDVGQAAVSGGRYRLVSPVFSRASAQILQNAAGQPQRLRPTRLLKVALTNDPNLGGMEPLSNRQDEPSSAQSTTKTTRMKSVALKLGLAAEASEEAVLAAVETLSNRASTAEAALTPLQNRNTELASENSALLADVFTTKHAARFAPDKVETAKAEFLKNRAGFEATLGALAETKPAAAAPAKSGLICNRATAKTPDANKECAAVPNRTALVEDYRLKNRCSFEQAWNAVKAAKPELFVAAE